MKIDVLGVKIDALTKTEVIKLIQERLDGGQSAFLVTPYSESIVKAQKDEEFRRILNSADFALPDGIGILWAANFLESRTTNHESRATHSPFSSMRRGRLGGGRILKALGQLIYSLAAIIFNPSYIRSPIPEKISGSEFVWDLTKLAAENNYSVFLLGGFGDTPELVASTLAAKYPNLKISGTLAPPSPGDLSARASQWQAGGEGGEEVEKINSSGADFLFVALGPVAQEKWIYQNLPNLRVKLAIGLGGTFDYLAGKRPYRAQFWASKGLEWLWRLATQPWRAARIFKGVLGLIYYAYKVKLQ